jgi:Alginate export
MKTMTLSTLLCATTLLASATAFAAEPAATPAAPVKDEFTKALTEGKVLFDTRYRYEHVDQDGLTDNANAHTLRSRLGYQTGNFNNFGALVEFEGTTDFGDEDYNNTINGKTTYPTVADIDGAHLNRLALTYSGLPGTMLTLGRQVLLLDNQRWVGPGAWRQDDQTHDAFSLVNTSLPGTTFTYAYSQQVNRTLGDRSPVGVWDDTHIHLLNASYAGWALGKLTGYGYLLDIPDSLSSSTETFGARFEGKQAVSPEMGFIYAAEYAHQSDYADNPGNYGLNYYSLEPGLTFGQWTLKGQYESIEGNGTNAVQFPLATLHIFDGWTDKFLVTPANGLVDANLGVTYVAKSENPYLNGTKAMLVYHDFSAERSSSDYGTEWDALIEQTFNTYYTAGLKFGHYNADDLYTDTTKIMPYVQVKF